MSVDTPRWVRDAVFYQIFPDRFAASERVAKPGPMEAWDAPPTPYGFKGGDLLGIVERLDYLEDLGVNALYLTPIFSSASNHRYHTDDYEHVDPLLGGDPALRELLDACHARGMRVVLDGVFNHCGRGWFPFHHVVEVGRESPYVDWFWIDRDRLAQGGLLQPYPDDATLAAMRSAVVEQGLDPGVASERFFGYRGWWGLPALPKICVEHPPAREYLLEIGERWLRFGADGWRLDVPQEVEFSFWQAFRQRVRAVDPEAYLVGEIWRVAPDWLKGDAFDALMDYPLAEAIMGYVAGDHLDWAIVNAQDQYRDGVRVRDGRAFGEELQRLLTIYDPDVVAVQLNLLGSHDAPRFVTVCGGDADSFRLGTLIQMTLPGAPCIYYGDEVGLEGGVDPDPRRAFPWDTSRWDTERHAFVKGAVALRRANPVLRHGLFRVVATDGAAMAYLRAATDDAEGDGFVICLNPGTADASLVIDLPADVLRQAEPVAWSGWPAALLGRLESSVDGAPRAIVPARGGLVLRVRGNGTAA